MVLFEGPVSVVHLLVAVMGDQHEVVGLGGPLCCHSTMWCDTHHSGSFRQPMHPLSRASRAAHKAKLGWRLVDPIQMGSLLPSLNSPHKMSASQASG